MDEKKIVLISDFLLEEIFGGCEINDDILYKELLKHYEVKKIKSTLVKIDNINKKNFYIISNFVFLNDYIKNKLIETCEYIIYEHDHKYCKNKNPAVYKDFIVPEIEIINKKFYENAKGVLCQSSFHEEIIRKNLNLNNLINLSGNLWDDETLNKILLFSKKEKKDVSSIIGSNINHKNTLEAIKYCQIKNKKYELVSDKNNLQFLNKLSNNKELVFFPQTPETFSRISVEARMCNMVLTTNNLVGATKEDWFYKKGEELVDFLKNKRKEIIEIVLTLIRN